MLIAIDYAGKNSNKTAINLFVKDEIIIFIYQFIDTQIRNDNLMSSSFTISLEILSNFSLFKYDTVRRMCELGFFNLPINLPSLSDSNLEIFIQILSHFAGEDPVIAFEVLNTQWFDMLKDVYERMTNSLKEKMIELFCIIADSQDEVILHRLIEVNPKIIDWLTEELYGIEYGKNEYIISLCLKAINIIADYSIGKLGEGIQEESLNSIVNSLHNEELICAAQTIVNDGDLNPVAIENAVNILRNLSPSILNEEESQMEK